MLGGITKVFQGLNLPGSIAGQLGAGLFGAGNPSAAQRTAFVQLLTAYARHAGAKQGPFNVELEMNDLWIRLGNLKSSDLFKPSPQQQMQAVMSQMSQMMGTSTRMINALDQALKESISNAK